jgi:hypothetical protein
MENTMNKNLKEYEDKLYNKVLEMAGVKPLPEDSIVTRTAYQTSDERLFVNEREAVTHEAELRMLESFRDYGLELGVEFYDVLPWIKKSKNEIEVYLKGIVEDGV